MAEKQSSSIDLAGQISSVDANIYNIFDARKNILTKLKEADKNGDIELAQQLANEAMTLSDALEQQQSHYSLLQDKAEEPERKRREGLLDELERPYEKPPLRGYSPYGLMPNAPDSTVDLNVPERAKQIERKREILSELGYIAPPSGSEKLPASLLAQLGSLPTPEGKTQLLENTFGKGNVLPIDVGGNPEFVIKLPDGSTKTTLEQGLAGLAGAAAVEVPLTIAEGAAGLTALGATKSPYLAAGAAAGTRATLGTGIDEALRLSYGLGSDLSGSMARRGTEAAIGLGLDAASAGVAGSIASRMPSQFDNRFAQALETSQQRLMTAEQKLAAKQGRQPGVLEIPAGAAAGQIGVEIQSELAGRFSKTRINNLAASTQDTLVRLFDNFRNDIPVTPNDFADIATGKEAQRSALAQELAGLTGRNKRIIESALDRQTKGEVGDIDELGDVLLSSIKQAEDQQIKNVSTAYDEIFDLADNAGFSISPEEMLNVVSDLKREVNTSGALDTNAVNAVMGRLRAKRNAPEDLIKAQAKLKKITDKGGNPPQDLLLRIEDLSALSKPITSRDFDDFIKAFREARPDNVASGANKDVFGRKIASKLSDYRRDVYNSINATRPDGTIVNIGDLFENASQEVALRQGYEANLLGNILKEAAGEQARTPRDIVSAVLKEPATVDRVVKSLRELGASNPSQAGEADRILGLLQVQYMNDIGIGKGGAREIKVDSGMLKSLFGSSAGAQQRSIEELNRNLRQIKGLDEAKLSLEDLQRMGQPISEQERKALTKTITKRLQLEKEEKRLISSKIFKLAEDGSFDNIDPDILSKSILSPSSTIGEVTVAMRELSKSSIESRNLYKGDFKRELLEKYRGGDPTANAPFQPLFDTKKFIADYESPAGQGKTQFAKKIEIVLGKNEADKLYDIAKLFEAAKITDTSSPNFPARTMVSSKGGVTVIALLAQAKDSIRNRYIAAMLGNEKNTEKIRRALSKNFPGGVNDAYNDIFRDLFLTRTGVTALAHQASSDPEFSAELLNTAKEFSQKQGIPEENLPNPRR